MNITATDIIALIGIIIVVVSHAISIHVAVKAGIKQKAQQEKDAKTKKSEPSSPTADTGELRTELDDLKKRVAAIEKK